MLVQLQTTSGVGSTSPSFATRTRLTVRKKEMASSPFPQPFEAHRHDEHFYRTLQSSLNTVFYYQFVIAKEVRLKQSSETTGAVKEIASRRHTGQRTMFAMTNVFIWFGV